MLTILFTLSDHFYFCYAINYTTSEKAFYMSYTVHVQNWEPKDGAFDAC